MVKRKSSAPMKSTPAMSAGGERTRLHIYQYVFGWIIVILMAVSIVNFQNGQPNVNLNTSLVAILMLGILAVMSGRRK